MNLSHKKEIWLLFFILTISALIGWVFNQVFLFISLALSYYIFTTLKNLFLLHNWLINRKGHELPVSQGLWGGIFNELYYMEKAGIKNKAALKDTVIRFQQAAAVIPDAMIILNKYNTIDWSNEAANKLLGINYPNDIGQPIGNLFRNPAFLQYLEKSDFSQTLTIPSPEHPVRTIIIQVIPYVKRQKLIICRDISHVTRLEGMRSNFVANVSHELRSPITVLSGYLETLMNKGQTDPDRLTKAFSTMFEQSKRMERLITDLLSLSRLETKPTDNHDDEIDITALLNSVKESAQLLSAEQAHEISLEITSELNLKGNRGELYSMFSNLVNNAVRYTPEHGKINIKWHLQDQDQHPVFLVQDNGPGISSQHIPHLTERFYRVDIDRSRESGGTGLGLAIVKHVLERHEGYIEINSKLGEGSTFICHFPKHRAINKLPNNQAASTLS